MREAMPINFLRSGKIFAADIKLAHSIFALPFAVSALFLNGSVGHQ